MLTLFLFAFSVSSSFEAGALKSYEWKTPTHLVATIPGQSDQSGRNHQPSWFYFSIDGVKGREITVDLAGLEGEYNFRPHNGSGHRNMHPAYSYDNVHWKHFDSAEWLETPSRIRVKFKAPGDRIWIARIPPYTLSHMQALLDSIQSDRNVTVREFGRSVQDRPLYQLTITDVSVPVERKKTIWIVTRQHAWEAGTSWVFEGAVRFLLSSDPAAHNLRQRYVFQMMPTLDPDGVALGGVRFNRNGFDLNRNWDVDDPVKMPEIAATKKAFDAWLAQGRSIDFFLTIHNDESTDYLAGPLTAGAPAIKDLAQRLNALLASSTHFHPAGGLRDSGRDESAPGRLNVDRWVFKRCGAPAFLMELMTDPNPKLGHPPLTQDRLSFGRALVRLIDEALTSSSAE